MHIYERLGVRSVINARSFSTKVGGCALPHEVLDAMREASDSCVYMHELHEAASRIIAEATDAEAGMVTSGASAALTLATQTVLGAAQLASETRLSPEELRKMVVTPGGTTAAGLDAMEKMKTAEGLIAAVEAAAKRGNEMAQQNQ